MTTTFSLDDLAARTEALLSRYEALAHAHTEDCRRNSTPPSKRALAALAPASSPRPH